MTTESLETLVFHDGTTLDVKMEDLGLGTKPVPSDSDASLTYELARSISILRSAHYSHCTNHQFPDDCPVFRAWDERRPR